jgi:hypothetical protein
MVPAKLVCLEFLTPPFAGLCLTKRACDNGARGEAYRWAEFGVDVI